MIRSNIKQNLNLRSLKNANLQHTQLTLLRSSGFSASSSPLLGLLRKAPDIAQILCRSFTPKRHRQLRVKDLPKVLTWRIEWDSNPRPYGRKALTLPMRHHIPQFAA